MSKTVLLNNSSCVIIKYSVTKILTEKSVLVYSRTMAHSYLTRHIPSEIILNHMIFLLFRIMNMKAAQKQLTRETGKCVPYRS